MTRSRAALHDDEGQEDKRQFRESVPSPAPAKMMNLPGRI